MGSENREEEQGAENVKALLVGLSRFAPGQPGDTVFFGGPRLPRRNWDANHEAAGKDEP